jgi:hypothetical protein
MTALRITVVVGVVVTLLSSPALAQNSGAAAAQAAMEKAVTDMGLPSNPPVAAPATRRNRSICATEKLLTPMALIFPWSKSVCIASAVSSIGTSGSGQCT